MYSEDKDYNKAHVPSYEQVLQTGGLWLEGGDCLYIFIYLWLFSLVNDEVI